MIYAKKKGSSAFMFIYFASKEQNLEHWLFWENKYMPKLLSLAIELKLHFRKSDFKRIYNDGNRWFGKNSDRKGQGEDFYILARNEEHLSAMKSYEYFAGIKPFIFKKERVVPYDAFLCRENILYTIVGFDAEKGTICMTVKKNGIEGDINSMELNIEEWKVFCKKE